MRVGMYVLVLFIYSKYAVFTIYKCVRFTCTYINTLTFTFSTLWSARGVMVIVDTSSNPGRE